MRHPTKHLRFFLASLAVAGLLAGPAAFGGTAYAQAANGGPAAEKAGAVGKVGFALTALSNEYHAFVNRNGNDAGFVPGNILLPVVGGKVVIDAAANGDARALERALQALGLQNSAVAGRLVSGRLPFGSIRAAGALAGLRFARPAYAATRVGSVTSEADYVMHSDFARSSLGVTGAGQTVGVLSDSYDRSASASTNAEQDIASFDLPGAQPDDPVITILDDPACSGCIDEGRAMMQLIHDIAPGANLAFHTAFTGQAGFAQGIKDLAAAGANIIVDDVIYFAEPMFQDGVIAQAVDDVVAGGVAYFSAAGNDARDGYEKLFNPGNTLAAREFRSARFAPRFHGGVAHDFDPAVGDDNVADYQLITIPAKRTVYFSVQWQQPFSSACENCPGATTDMDVYLLNSADKVVAGGISNNIGGDPVEVFGVSNGGNTPAQLKLIIVKFDDTHPDPGLIKYVAFGNPSIDTFDTASGTVYGHAGALGAEAVGAAFYRTPDELESFSSAGPVRILFNESGAGIQEETRYKPEIVAPDGTNTTFFYVDTSLDLDSFPNFFGTSAAAPHAAGVAALLRQYNGSLTPAQIYAALEDSAIDITKREGGITLDPVNPDSNLGRDDDSGYGLIQADAALDPNNLAPNNAPVVTITSPDDGITVAEGDTVVFAVDVSDVEDNDTLLTADIVWTSNLVVDPIGYGAGFSTAGLSVDTHTITATVADFAVPSLEGSDSVTVEVTGGGGGGGGGDMHVGDLDGSSEISGRNLNKWTAMVTITVHDAGDTLVVAGADVSGVWSEGARGGGSCTTDAGGQCTVSKGNLKLDAQSATFTVTDVTLDTWTYVSGANHDPDGDSDGRVITVDQPLP